MIINIKPITSLFLLLGQYQERLESKQALSLSDLYKLEDYAKGSKQVLSLDPSIKSSVSTELDYLLSLSVDNSDLEPLIRKIIQEIE